MNFVKSTWRVGSRIFGVWPRRGFPKTIRTQARDSDFRQCRLDKVWSLTSIPCVEVLVLSLDKTAKSGTVTKKSRELHFQQAADDHWRQCVEVLVPSLDKTARPGSNANNDLTIAGFCHGCIFFKEILLFPKIYTISIDTIHPWHSARNEIQRNIWLIDKGQAKTTSLYDM